MVQISRRAFVGGLASVAVPGVVNQCAGMFQLPVSVKGGKTTAEVRSKWDLTLFDRPGWCSHAWYHIVEPDGSILVPIQSSEMRFPYGDFIRTRTDDLVLKSSDTGRTWTTVRNAALTAFPWGCYGLPGKTADGRLVSVISADYVLSEEERKEHLEKHGLARFYGSHSEWLYRPWPLAMADGLRRQGIFLFEGEEGSGQMAFSLLGYCCRLSKDAGKTWATKPIMGLPFFSDEAGSFRNTIVTQKGAWVASVFGTPNANHDPAPREGFGTSKLPIGSYVLRSENEGQSWNLQTIAYDPSGEHSFDETALLELPTGRILALLRHSGFTDPKQRDISLFQSHSDDGGKTWSTPVSSGIVGYPAHLLRLKDGKLLCTVGYRADPWGHRAIISVDEGKTWNIHEPKIIRDDSIPGWTTYPMSSQLPDGTIFTTYGLLKQLPPAAHSLLNQPGTFRSGKQREFVYAGASIYDGNYTHPIESA
jgi:hypothetical protein